eukprot:352377-Rhodomonas_salina.2
MCDESCGHSPWYRLGQRIVRFGSEDAPFGSDDSTVWVRGWYGLGQKIVRYGSEDDTVGVRG